MFAVETIGFSSFWRFSSTNERKVVHEVLVTESAMSCVGTIHVQMQVV